MFFRFVALGLAGVLDLSAGLLFTQLLSDYFAYPLVWWQYALGAIFGAAPDIDLFWAFFKKNPSGHHEYLTHRPIVGVSLAATLGWILGGEFWAWCAGIGVCWHYIHDTEGFLFLPGGGITWLWPFSRKYWSVEGFQVVSRTHIVHWVAERNADDEFTETYLAPTRRSVTELALTGIFSSYVVGDLLGFGVGVGAFIFFWWTIVELWNAYNQFAHRSTQAP